MSYHVVFLEHIPFFFILSTTYSLTRSDLIHINLFSEDSDSLSSQVPSTSNTSSYVRTIHTDYSAGIDNVFSGISEALFFFSIISQAPFKSMNPPLC